MKDDFYVSLLISYDSAITSHPRVSLRGSIYIKFQKSMRRWLPKVLPRCCMSYDLAYALGDKQLETQMKEYMSILISRRVLGGFL